MAGLDRRSAVIGLGALTAACATPDWRKPGYGKIVIGHRGCSGERPEHTMESYRRAIEQGADFVEPDLVLTKDGVLVCRHENNIAETTDVADRKEFADRRRTKLIDGESVTGWFTEDFTLQELRQVRCKERLPQLRPANTAFDGKEPIPTFEDLLILVRNESARRNRRIGVYPEAKHPTHFGSLGLWHGAGMIKSLRAHGFGGKRGLPVYIQCFEPGFLKWMASATNEFKRILLASRDGGPADLPGTTYAQMLNDEGLKAIARYADGIGVEKTLIVPQNPDQTSAAPTDLVGRAHKAGLKVHVWTFRAENTFLPAEFRRGDAAAPDYARQHGDLDGEVRKYFGLGVDGVFSDFPGIARAAGM